MEYRNELISLAIGAVGAIVCIYATVFSEVGRNAAIWINYVGACVMLLAPFFYAQTLYWEQEAEVALKVALAAADSDLIDAELPILWEPLAVGQDREIDIKFHNRSDSHIHIEGIKTTCEIAAVGKCDVGKLQAALSNIVGEKSEGVLFPKGAEKTQIVILPGEAITEEVLRDLRAGERIMYVITVIGYTDSAKRRRISKFCWTTPGAGMSRFSPGGREFNQLGLFVEKMQESNPGPQAGS